ncbi:MAG TPA: N-acetylmuramic acid 6-phosphate etherase [Acidocella sp.]|nr:N-acetylmuramic acid 6-phosphate etherase [Acidocella sp.]
MVTETTHELAPGLDLREPQEIVTLLAESQMRAAAAVGDAAGAIAAAARRAAEALRAGGRLVYAGAGSSGLLALTDALELPGTFGLRREQLVVLFAGAPATLTDLAGGVEDDAALGRAAVRAASVAAPDCVIAVSASGSTPYTLAVLDEAQRRGAVTIAIANNADAPLLAAADVPIHLATGAEIVAGSTRLGAGTAQKVALNSLSTLVAVLLGEIMDGEMVNLQADNAKLRQRAERIVGRLGQADAKAAAACLAAAQGSVKHAILLAAGAGSFTEAEDYLKAEGMHLRSALRRMQMNKNQTV